MSRIEKLAPEAWDQRLKDAVDPSQLTDLEQGNLRFFAHRPELALGMMPFAGALKNQRTLSDRLVELVRLRVAFFNQCRSCMAIRYSDGLADGVDEDLVCSLERPQEAADLTEAEKAALHFAELFATNHLAIDDAVFDSLREHFSEAQIVELGMQVAFFVGFGRLAATMHMVEELPDEFRQEGDVTPWGNPKINVR